MPETPGFHHLHLNSIDPDAAIEFYTRRFPTTSKTSWGGLPALASPNNVLVLFTKVAAPPATSPQTAIWHFGWHVLDSRRTMEKFRGDRRSRCCRCTRDEGGTVFISSDTWPGAGGVPGRTMEQIAEAKATGVQPTRTGGFGYMPGPTMRSSSTRATARPSASTTCTCTRKTPSAPSSGTRCTSTRRCSRGASSSRDEATCVVARGRD